MHICKIPLLAVGRNVNNTGADLRYHISDAKRKNNLNTKSRVLNDVEMNPSIEESMPNLLRQDTNFSDIKISPISSKPNKFLSLLEMTDHEIKAIREMLNNEQIKYNKQNKQAPNSKAQKRLTKTTSSKNIIKARSGSIAYGTQREINVTKENPNASSALSLIEGFAAVILMVLKKEGNLLKQKSRLSKNTLAPAVVSKYKIFDDTLHHADEHPTKKNGYSVFGIRDQNFTVRQKGYSVFSNIDTVIDSSAWHLAPREGLNDKNILPSIYDIIKFISRIFVMGKLEKDSLIPALVYLEKFCMEGYKSGFKITPSNWKTLIFTMLILSSKMWDDLSISNMDMTNLWSGMKLERINQLERHALEILKYSLNVTPSVYSAYYFKLREIHFASGTLISLYDPCPYLKPLVNADRNSSSSSSSSSGNINRNDTDKSRPKSSPIKKTKQGKLSDENSKKKLSANNSKTINTTKRLHSRPVLRFKQLPMHKRALLLTHKHLGAQNTYPNNTHHARIFGINPNKLHFEGARRKKTLPILKKYHPRKTTLGRR